MICKDCKDVTNEVRNQSGILIPIGGLANLSKSEVIIRVQGAANAWVHRFLPEITDTRRDRLEQVAELARASFNQFMKSNSLSYEEVLYAVASLSVAASEVALEWTTTAQLREDVGDRSDC